MVLTSLTFFLFFLLVFVLYWRINKKYQSILLLLVSYYFYLSWKPAYGLFIFITTLVVYFVSLGLKKFSGQKKIILLSGLLYSLGLLFIFKYYNLFSFTLNSAFDSFGFQFGLPQFKLLLPLGISFYTFQTIGYLIDVYRGKTKPERNFANLALFVSFFPNIISGPIERGWHLIPQLTAQHKFKYESVVSGLKLFAWGVFKKLVVADNLGVVVDRVFDNLPEYKGLSLVFATFFFSLQIYADFSGYTDMARGVARMLGINLLENFKTPYLSTSVREFWRRWHISLSSWFKDYVYIPLGGSKKGILRTYINNIIVFLLCGLWHGAAWNFVLWGLGHGLFISIERFFGPVFATKLKFLKYLAMPFTFFVVMVFWVLFRAKNITEAIYIYQNSLSGLRHFLSPGYVWATLSQLFKTNMVEMVIVFFCVFAIFLTELLANKESLSQAVARQSALVRWSIYVALVSLIILLRNANVNEFIYVQF